MFKDDIIRDRYSGKIRKFVSPPVKPDSPDHGLIGAFFTLIPGVRLFPPESGGKKHQQGEYLEPTQQHGKG